MAHGDQMSYFRLGRDGFPNLWERARVLEVGSLDINGSVRHLTTECDYVGIDIAEGPGVDVVVAGQDFDAPDDTFDLVLSGECMEHNPAWEATTRNMLRLLKPGGMFLLTCAAPGRDEHGTTRTTPWASPLTVAIGQDYYKNLEYRDFKKSGTLDLLSVHAHWLNWRTRDLYIAGFKGTYDPSRWVNYVESVDRWLRIVHKEEPIPRTEQVVLWACGRRIYERTMLATRFPRRLRKKIQRTFRRGAPSTAEGHDRLE